MSPPEEDRPDWMVVHTHENGYAGAIVAVVMGLGFVLTMLAIFFLK